MIIDRGQVFPALVDLFESSDWSVRLGAMVVVEEIPEKSTELLEEMLEVLWNRLHAISSPTRGDVLYLFGLGQPGSKLWIDRLNGLLENEDGEGREAVLEALEKLGGK